MRWWRSPLAWLKAHPFHADAGLAVLLLGLSLPGLFGTEDVVDVDFRDPDVFAVALVVAGTLPLAWRRQRPVQVLAAVGVAVVVLEAFGYPSATGSVPVLVALYTVAAHCDRRTSLQAAAVTAAALLVVLLTSRWDADAAAFAQNYVVFATAWILGDNVRTRRAYTAELEARAARLEHEREEQARWAAADERSRIARELHDVVSHGMSVMVVQAGAARRVLDTDPARAREAMTAIEATGRQALAEMRRMLDVLRPSVVSEALDPQPSVLHLDALVAKVNGAGLPVDLVVEGDPRPVSSGVDVSAYRIVQEALTNTIKHAGPARAQVVVRYGDDDLEVVVTDDGRGLAQQVARGDRRGQGLVGMKERVALFGGELRTGPRPGGGYQVRARLPLDGDES